MNSSPKKDVLATQKYIVKAKYKMPGGIHPAENKVQSLTQAIQTLDLPTHLTVPIAQPAFQTAVLKVAIGDYVLKGQELAGGSNLFSLRHHAPSSGTIEFIESRPVANTSGIEEMCIGIATDGKDQWVQRETHPDYHTLSFEQLLNIITHAGINGMGGAGFPSHIKLNQPSGIDTLIINACECEPFITSDAALMGERSDDIVAGIYILMYLLQAKQCLIGIEDNKPEALQNLATAIANTEAHKPSVGKSIQLVSIPSQYPAGSEKQLIKVLTGIEVPSGSIAVQSGLLCHNVATVYAVARAVIYGEPVLSRITTATGAALASPSNWEVLIGTPISMLLKACQIDKSQMSELIMGGPLMGINLPPSALTNNMPISKISNCVIATTETELPPSPPAQACIRCGLCTMACPINLLPQQLYWFARSKEHDKAQAHNLADCIECGACAYVCPSHIPLVQYYRAAKASIKDESNKHSKAQQSQRRFEFHQTRKEQEKVVADQRRKDRAALAKQKAADGSKAQNAIQAALDRVKAKKTKQVEQETKTDE